MPELEPVREDIIADSSKYVAALEAAAAVAAQLAKANDAAAAAVHALQEAMDSLAAGAAEAAGAEDRLAEAEQSVGEDAAAAAGGVDALAAGLDTLIGHAAAAAGALGRIDDSLSAMARDAAADSAVIIAALSRIDDSLNAMARDATMDAAVVIVALNAVRDAATSMAISVATASAAAGAGTAAGMRIGIGWLRLGVANWQTFLHWAVAGSAELLSVLIPAMVAAGAGAAVMAQGVGDARTHLTAMYTAQEATANIFHTTIGDMLGMGHALQSAQNAADPHVWELLGAGINAAKAASGGFVTEGTKVLGVLDNFGAKVVADLQGAMGAKLHGLLSNGVADLTAFGQVLGNVGHAILNFASAMPGLAGVLLGIVDGVSKVAEVLSSMPGHIITAYMALEEFNRWGSVVVGGMGRMGLAANTLSGSFFTFGSRTIGIMSNVVKVVPMALAAITSNIGSAMTAYGRLGGAVQAGDGIFTRMGKAVGNAGMAVRGFGADMTDAIVAFPAGWAAAIAAVGVGLGLLVYHFASAKTAAQEFTDSLQQAVEKASNLHVYQTIAQNLAALAPRYEQAAAAAKHYSSETDTASAGQNRLNAALGMQAKQAMGSYHAGMVQQQHDLNNALAATAHLERFYGTTFVGALALADAAGVKLANGITGTGQAATNARIKIANYVAGMNAMGAQTSTVGHDVTLLGIDSALAATHVQQLQQAFSDFVTNMTGGTNSLSGFEQALTGLTKGANQITTILGRSGSVTLSVQQFAQDLTRYTGAGAQAWQNFDGILTGSASQLVQWFQLAGSEGAVGSHQFTAAMQDMVSQFVPFAAKSKTAQQELVGFANAAGLNVSSWSALKHQLDAAGASGKGLGAIVSGVTGRMSNMNSVARALGSSIGSSVVASMNSARLVSSGLTTAAQNLATAWFHVRSVTPGVIGAFRTMYGSLQDVYHNTTLSRNAINAYAQQLGMTKGQIETLDSAIGIMGSHVSNVGNTTQQAGAQASGLTGKLNELNNEVNGAAGKMQSMASQIHSGGQAAQTAAGQMSNLHTQIGNASSAASTAIGKMSAAGGAMSSAGSQAQTAAGKVYALSSAIAGLQSKTITITTNMVTATTHRASGGPVLPGMPYKVGEAGEELFTPAVPGYIYSHPDTQRILAGAAGSGQGTPAGSGGYNGPSELHSHITVQLDRDVVARHTQVEALRWEHRNGRRWSDPGAGS